MTRLSLMQGTIGCGPELKSYFVSAAAVTYSLSGTEATFALGDNTEGKAGAEKHYLATSVV